MRSVVVLVYTLNHFLHANLTTIYLVSEISMFEIFVSSNFIL